MTNLDAVKLIQALLDDPHPGLSTWREALSNALDDIVPERTDDNIFPVFGLSLPPIGVGPFSPSGEHTDLTNGPFHLDIVASKQELSDFKELKLSITDGYGNLVTIVIGLGLMGNVSARIVLPLEEHGLPLPLDMNIHLFNVEMP
jgi:hypothetical protein